MLSFNNTPRVLTLTCVVRKYQIETTRNTHEGQDETELHSVKTVSKLAEIIRKGMPDAKINWAISWYALHDQTERFVEIRKLIKSFQEKFGDSITFILGGYFANRYNTRDQINTDISEALGIIQDWIGTKPKSLIAGFLSSDNIRYARQREGIIGVQGNVWSQYAVDNQDGEGSIAYPYYPSAEHFCKPAQGTEDFTDCLNFDGWTVDFFNARVGGKWKRKTCPRMGVGPIETLGRFGGVKGVKEMLATTEAHFGTSSQFNPFTWITNTIEVSLVSQIKDIDYITKWLSLIHQKWPDAQCPTLEDFAQQLHHKFPNNDRLTYELHQRGDINGGIGIAKKKHEIIWHMNKLFRCGIEVDKKGTEWLFDYTPYYKIKQSEPQNVGERNWSLWGPINQKQLREQDRPVLKDKFTEWDFINQKLIELYPRKY
jgi:hypothetical protein